MYGKIHDCIFGSSIMEEDVVIRYIWMCMITIADKNGIVDETIPALARRFNVNVNEMIKAIDSLEKTDISSRTPEQHGKRIEKIRDTFGWRILNYDYYRGLQSSQDRKEYMRDYMRIKRKEDFVNNPLTNVSTLADTDTDTDTDKTNVSFKNKFESFWKAYPKRKAKADAERAFKKINPNKSLLKEIIDSIERQIVSQDWTKNGGQYIPLPATWLNGKRWLDEVDDTKKSFTEVRHI